MKTTEDGRFAATAFIDNELLTDEGIDRAELLRARHALAYLKNKLGVDAIRALLQDDLAQMAEQVKHWVETSRGEWQVAHIDLVAPGPTAMTFALWYREAISSVAHERALRAGHPEHFISHPRSGVNKGTLEVAENIGETDLPWHIIYQPLSEGRHWPISWNAEAPANFGSEIVDLSGLLVGFTMHELSDTNDGLAMRLTTCLPSAVPKTIIDRHLRHFAVEFRNWAALAYQQERS